MAVASSRACLPTPSSEASLRPLVTAPSLPPTLPPSPHVHTSLPPSTPPAWVLNHPPGWVTGLMFDDTQRDRTLMTTSQHHARRSYNVSWAAWGARVARARAEGDGDGGGGVVVRREKGGA